MPIQINVPLTDRAGFAVPSGSYCVIDINISTRKQLNCEIRFFKDKASFDNLADSFWPTGDFKFRLNRQLTNPEYANFNNITLHQFVQLQIEEVTGPGTTQLVQ